MRFSALVSAVLGTALVVAPGLERTARADPAFNIIWISSAALLAAGALGDAVRGNDIGSESVVREVDLLTFGAGMHNVWKDNEPDGDIMPGMFRFEYRPSYYLWITHPIAGIEVTTQGATYLYGGLMADVRFGKNFIVSPSAAVGWYNQADGRKLGLPLEFRTGLEAAWRFDDGLRVGAAFHHLSNAEFGDSNPGVEEATLNVSVPIQYFVKR